MAIRISERKTHFGIRNVFLGKNMNKKNVWDPSQKRFVIVI